MNRRSRPRAYLLLARVSNLPTVWTNVIAGAALSGASMNARLTIGVAVAVSLWYSAGMWMNDACDADADAAARRERPIPNGDVTCREVWIGTAFLALAGAGVMAWSSADRAAWVWVALLGLAIAYYNVRHKGDPFGPAAMGLCRGLIYLIAASAMGRGPGLFVWIGAVVLITYVLGLTWVGKTLGPRAGVAMPLLIAGISLVDALLILTLAPMAGMWWALAAVAGFPLTLAGQRAVPGT